MRSRVTKLTPEARCSWQAIVPGTVLAVALAIMALLAANAIGARLTKSGSIPVSPILIAVLLGIAWRNVVGVGRRARHGLEWSTRTLLRIGIALVGLRLTLHGLGTVGATALPIVTVCIAVALLTSLSVGRALGISTTLQLLIALGTGVCGCTAIVAAAPAIHARPAETSLALTCIVLFGCIGMLFYPWLAHAVFVGSTTGAGIFLGSAIHDTSQVIGASLIYSQQFGAPEAVAAAGATKLMRNMSLVVLVPFAAWWARRAAARDIEALAGVSFGAGLRGKLSPMHCSQILPGFMIAFLGFVLLRTIGDQVFAGGGSHLWARSIAVSQSASEILLVCGISAVGLGVSLADLRSLGWRAACTAFVAAILTASYSLGLTLLTN